MPPKEPKKVSFALERNEIFLPHVREAEKKVRQYLQRGAQTKEIKELPPIVSSEAQRKETKVCPPTVGRQVITTSPLSRYKEGSKLDPNEWKEEQEKLCQVQKAKETSSDPLELARRIISMPHDYEVKDMEDVYMAVKTMRVGLDRKAETRDGMQATNHLRILSHSNKLQKILAKLGDVIIAGPEEKKLSADFTRPGSKK